MDRDEVSDSFRPKPNQSAFMNMFSGKEIGQPGNAHSA